MTAENVKNQVDVTTKRQKMTELTTEKYPKRVEGKEWLNWLAAAYFTIKESPHFRVEASFPLGEVHIWTFDRFERVYGKELADVHRDISILHELIHLKLGPAVEPHGRLWRESTKAVLRAYIEKREVPLTPLERAEVEKEIRMIDTVYGEESSSNPVMHACNPGDNEEEECDFCGEKVEYKFPFKIGGRPVEWHVCSSCLEALRHQLRSPTPKEEKLHAPKEAYVFPALCQFCGKSIEFNPDTQRFTEKIYTLDMLYYFVDICEPCTKEMLVAVDKAEKIGFAGSNPASPVVPYWVIPAAFTTVFAVVCFVGWVASELEKGLKQKTT